MKGQINLAEPAGKVIKEISGRTDVSTIVEIGTWNGMGSTQCVLEGIKKSDKTFFTIECAEDMYKEAIQSDPKILLDAKRLIFSFCQKEDLPNVHYLLGRIIEEHELETNNLAGREKSWLETDIKAMSQVPNVIHKLPKEIDFLILDGGEFSSRAEFLKLKDKSKIIFLDDTGSRKNRINHRELSSDSNYKLLMNKRHDRRGWAVYERVV